MRRVTVLLLVVTALSACTGPTPGPPTPTTSGPVTTTAPPRVQLPPRPRDVPIDGIAPCDLLTEAQRADLDLDGTPIARTYTTRIYGLTRLCSFGGTEPREVSVGVSLAPEAGVERFIAEATSVELTAIDVGGFPAVLARPTALTDFCSVEIDVAPGQLIDVQYGLGSLDDPIPQDQLCLDAQRVAEEVVVSLLAQ